jgi:tyrosyl-tRNA synthetase
MAKENVRKRLEREGSGISFQEFSYGLLQGYDFVHLYKEYGCRLQIAGTDNLGNMVTGQDLVHKMLGKDDVCGLTWDLITCADGRKFGKTEGNAVFLDPNKTSVYRFYQYWINTTDVDAESFIKKFTLIPLDEINKMIEEHRENPSKRLLQKTLAEYMTEMIHGKDALNGVEQATEFLFGGADVNDIDDNAWKFIKSEVPTVEVSKDAFGDGISVIDLANMHEKVPSKSEARKLIKGNGFSINKIKANAEKEVVSSKYLINGKYLLLTKGKKDHCLVVVG